RLVSFDRKGWRDRCHSVTADAHSIVPGKGSLRSRVTIARLFLQEVQMAEKYTSEEALASYAIGRQVGEQLAAQPFPGMEPDALVAGLAEVLKGQPSQYKDAELRGALDAVNQRMQRQQK